MKDALDKALLDQSIIVNGEDGLIIPHMKWLYKQPSKKINRSRMDSN
jgi:hypothetical protein